jgi:hypothetical protein
MPTSFKKFDVELANFSLSQFSSGALSAETVQLSGGYSASGSNINVDRAITATNGSISIDNYYGNISLGGSLNSQKGILIAAGGNVNTSVSGLQFFTDNASGNAGNFTVLASTSFSRDTNDASIQVLGPSTQGGSIDFLAQPINGIYARSTGGGGNGGRITMVAQDGDTNVVILNTAGNILASGSGGVNGTIEIVSGLNQAATAIDTTAANLNTSGNNTGSVIVSNSIPATGMTISRANALPSAAFATSTLGAGDVRVSSITAGGGNVSLTAGNNLNLSGSGITFSGSAPTRPAPALLAISPSSQASRT